MKKYTVLIVHNYYQQAGGEDSVVENEKAMLESNGHKVFLYTKSNEDLHTIGGKIIFFISFLYSKRTYIDVKKILQEEEIDIVHVHNTFPLITTAVYSAAYELGVPVVQTLHNFRFVCPGALYMRNGSICEECNQKGIKNAIQHKCYRNSKIQTLMAVCIQLFNRKRGMYDKVDGYIALTEFNKRKFEEEFPWCREKIYVKPNFISNSEKIQSNISGEYVYVGRLSEEKGIKVLLKAFEKMPQQRLTIVGNGNLETYVREYILEHHINNVNLTGKLAHAQVIEKLRCAKSLVVPSIWYEGFPMTIVEALSCGVPVIGSRLGNMQSIICEGENGLLFTPGDDEDLISKILLLESDSDMYQKMCEKAYGSYLKNYTEKLNYTRLIEIYDLIIEKKRRR